MPRKNKQEEHKTFDIPSTALTKAIKPLPPVSQLFSESWRVFKDRIVSLFLITLVIFALFFAVLIIFGVGFLGIGFGIGLFSAFSGGGIESLTSIPGSIYGLTLVYLAMFVLTLVFIGSLQSIAFILNVGNKEALPLGVTFRKSLSLILPFFITSLLIMFFSLGGFFAFILPVLVFYVFFIFAPYEVVLNNKSYFSAIKRSMLIVKNHFWAVLTRLLLMLLIYVILTSVLPNALVHQAPKLIAIINFVSFIINTLLGWFTIAYLVILYKQARVGLDFEKEPSLRWVWIISVVGWVIAVLLFLATYTTFKSEAFQEFLQTIQKQERIVPTNL